MSRALLLAVVLGFAAAPAALQALVSLVARAKLLELNTPYVPPPGDGLEHHASGFAKVMCSAVFITGLDPGFAAEDVGFFNGPYSERAKLGKPLVDRAVKAIHVTLPNGVRRTARYLGDQGCVTLPTGKDAVNFKPIRVKSRLPDPSTQLWPMGDTLPRDPLPAALYPAHVYLYTGSVDAFHYAATRPLQWPPGTVGR